MEGRKQKKNLSSGTLRGMIGDAVNYKRVLAVLAVLTAVVSVLTIWNASKLQKAINQRTRTYVADVSLQLASDIDFRLKKNILDLEILEDSLIQLEDLGDIPSLDAFLNRKAEILGFNSIVVIHPGGKFYGTAAIPGDIYQMPGIQDSLQGKNGVTFLDRQSILYSIPIHKDKEVVGALAGVRDRENMQKLIQLQSFSQQGLTCIVDSNGKVVISPTNAEPFMQLDDIFSEEAGNDDAVEKVRQMEKDLKKRKSGEFLFTAVDGTELVLSYDPLESYDWMLLTMVPANLISHQTNLYISQTFIIIGGTILLFFGVLILLFKAYHRYSRQLEKIAFVDHITGGMNNAAFQVRCAELLQKSPPNTYAVVLINIRNFKLINESFGSVRGDATLRYMMDVISHRVSDGELAARADADNFFLCLRENDPAVICQRLKDMTEGIQAFNADSQEPYYLTIQQGAYIVDDPSLEITVVQDRAKTACRSRSGFQEDECSFYSTSITKQLQKEHDLNGLFANSLESGDFKLFLQPKVRLEDRSVGGAEALVRWQHPQRGMIYPSDFIPFFEKNGRICQLDIYIFEQTCKTIRRWMDAGKEPFPVSVNLSRQHFQRQDCLNQFYEIAQRYQIPRGTIEMELTESVFFDDQGIETVKDQIHRMHEMGFRCSLDDFGSGYSSLDLLMEFDVDVIKLDRRFFFHERDSKSEKVISSIIGLAKEIGADVVAEGIEAESQLDFLCSAGCDMVQGYVFSKPLPVAEFEEWVRDFGPGGGRRRFAEPLGR